MSTLFRYFRSLLLVAAAGVFMASAVAQQGGESAVDRHSLVTRHNITVEKPDHLSPLSVGNGEFAFTADITGFQTFPEFHEEGMPLHTQSQWGWHSAPNPEGFSLDEVQNEYKVNGRAVPYADQRDREGRLGKANNWLRANPHRLDLGRIGLVLGKEDGAAARIMDLGETSQTQNLWEGILESRFQLEGQPVVISTVAHPARDMVAFQVESPLLASGRLVIDIAFPYGREDWLHPADWGSPDQHRTETRCSGAGCLFTRTLDADRYWVRAAWSDGASLTRQGPHQFRISAKGRNRLELRVEFSAQSIGEGLPAFAEVREAAAAHWKRFWTTGGVVDLSASKDPRWKELERRIVLSQYLTAINCAGSMPPQETGLVMNSWYGKFHLEMHWWHAFHFALWDRAGLLERSLGWYQKIMPVAQAKARRQGYAGARWPKMVGPDGRDSPSGVGEFLIWQQPHPIYFAEICYRTRPDRGTLDKYKDLVFNTAEFMALFPVWNEEKKQYDLPPPLIPAQESYDRRTTMNPTFELAYWHWALEVAQDWRKRLDMPPNADWDRVIQHLPKPSVRDGVYTAVENPPYTVRRDHPSMLAALGVVPATSLIDLENMSRTLDDVWANWDWESTWGWDYPVMAMCAARLGRPDKAVDALLVEAQKNTYLVNGHNFQNKRLPLYLPGNGGLLAAVAMMAAGWDGAPDIHAPGFPADGSWVVRWENLKPMP